MSVANKVVFPGRVGNLSDWYDAASLYVMTSGFEGYPNSLIEAMAHRLAAISYDCPSGPADVIVNRENGILISPNDQNQLYEAMSELMANPGLAKSLGENAGRIRGQHDVDSILDQWIDVCR